jgi:multiple sugar transport system substrate-binding protein
MMDVKREQEYRYTKLAGILREQILSGYIKPGEYLLSENELGKVYDMSRTSVRKSLEQLQKEGLIVKKVGQGTIVAPDLVLPETTNRVLRIFATSPAYFTDRCLPLIINRFKETHPDIEVKVLNFPSGELWDSVRVSGELGIFPDLVLVSDTQAHEADPAAFLDLNRPLEGAVRGMYPRLQRAFSRDNRLYAAPVTFSTVFLACNPDLFDRYGVPRPEPDWRKEDFLRAAQKLTLDTNRDGVTDLYGLTFSPVLGRWPVFALQNGVEFNGTAAMREPLERTLSFLHDLLYRYRIAVLSPKHQLYSDFFYREKAAMVLTTAIELGGWKFNFEPQVAALPFGEHPSTLLVANALMIPADCRNTEPALRFLETALDPETQMTMCRSTGFLSVLRAVNEAVWDKARLQSLFINDDRIENSQMVKEVFRDLPIVEDVEAEMALFWSGLESAADTAERITRIFREGAEGGLPAG